MRWGSEKIAETAWELWQRELMEIKSNDVHKEALKTGSAFLIVWPGDDGLAKFYVQDSRNCVVIKDEETDVPLFAAKMWKTKEELIRLTLYYPDRIEKYITAKKPTGMELKERHFVPVSEEEAVTANPYGVIPMFEFEAEAVLNNVIPHSVHVNGSFSFIG